MLTLFDQPTGADLRDKGMNQAIQHADEVNEHWSEKAYSFLQSFLTYTKGEFMAEEVRIASMHVLPEPPSKRAWGGVIAKAKRSGLIVHAGFKSVSNPKAHNTPASVWRKAA